MHLSDLSQTTAISYLPDLINLIFVEEYEL
jgi:hypothetical protein